MPAKDAPILVTGAAGHVGANLMHRLVEEGHRVRALLRRGENEEAVDGLHGVEKAYGDLRDKRSLQDAVEGCRRVFHVASMVSTIDGDAEHRRVLYETNVLGTRHLMQAAKKTGVERFVLTSSFSAVGYDLDETSKPADETMQFYPYHRAMPYERSKVLQEHELLKMCVEGLDALIVTSCAVIGGHDYLPSRMGTTLCKFANRQLNVYSPGGFEFVAARDIVDGHVRAMERGRTGQKYIVATQFLDFDHIFDMLEEITGAPRPKIRVPAKALLPLAEVTSWLVTRLDPKKQQLLTPGAIRRLQLRRHADTSKAQRELGFRPSSMRDAFMEAYAFHWSRGAIVHPGAKPPEDVPTTRTTAPSGVSVHA